MLAKFHRPTASVLYTDACQVLTGGWTHNDGTAQMHKAALRVCSTIQSQKPGRQTSWQNCHCHFCPGFPTILDVHFIVFLTVLKFSFSALCKQFQVFKTCHANKDYFYSNYYVTKHPSCPPSHSSPISSPFPLSLFLRLFSFYRVKIILQSSASTKNEWMGQCECITRPLKTYDFPHKRWKNLRTSEVSLYPRWHANFVCPLS